MALKILISLFAKPLRNGNTNAKNYPWPDQLIGLLKEEGHFVVQVGTSSERQIADSFLKDLPFLELSKLVRNYDLSISVDTYLNHLSWYIGKRGIVLWGPSDPNIWGHECHINLLKDRSYLRPDQFDIWEGVAVNKEAFVTPDEVIEVLKKNFT